MKQFTQSFTVKHQFINTVYDNMISSMAILCQMTCNKIVKELSLNVCVYLSLVNLSKTNQNRFMIRLVFMVGAPIVAERNLTKHHKREDSHR